MGNEEERKKTDILNIKKNLNSGFKNPKMSFSSILREETSIVFLERFTHRLLFLLKKRYEESIARRIATLLKNRILTIECPESFLFKYAPISDNSIQFYNNAIDLDDFLYNSLFYFRKRAEDGDTDIVIREFFIALMDGFSNKNKRVTISQEKIVFYMKYILFFLCNFTHPSPFILQLLHPEMLKRVQNFLDFDLRSYTKIYSYLFLHINDLLQKNFLTEKDAYFPKIEIIHPVYPSARSAQQYYLASTFKTRPYHVYSYTSKLTSLSERTPELEEVLQKLLSETNYQKINLETVYTELERLEKERPLKAYPLAKELYQGLPVFDAVKNSIYKNKKAIRTFVSTLNYQDTFQPYSTNILVNCANASRDKIEEYIDAAKNLALISGTAANGIQGGSNDSVHTLTSSALKITLTNVEDTSKEFIKFAEKKIKQISSITRRHFIHEIKYSISEILIHIKERDNGYIRVISDIHADVNKDKNYIFNFGNDFVINCGDTAGDSITCREWNKLHIPKGVVIIGNHLGYSPAHPELNDKSAKHMHYKNTKSEQLYEVGVTLTGDNGSPRILSNSEMDYKGLKILGTTLYTDFALYGEEHKEECMAYAQKYMNDFKYITVLGHREYKQNKDGTWDRTLRSKEKSTVRMFTPQDHAYYFSFSLAYLKQKVTEYKDKPIIIATHFAPTPYAISPKYAGNMLNPAFASNLNKFIIEHPNIRLWTFGHVHSSHDFILGETRMVCEPFGYGNENKQECKLPFKYGKRIKIDDIKSKRSWRRILSKEIKKGKIQCYDS